MVQIHCFFSLKRRSSSGNLECHPNEVLNLVIPEAKAGLGIMQQRGINEIIKSS